MPSPTVQANNGLSLMSAVEGERQQSRGPSSKRPRVHQIQEESQEPRPFPVVPTRTQVNNNCRIPVVTPKPDENDEMLNMHVAFMPKGDSSVVPKSSTPIQSIEILMELSKRRAAKSHAIAARILAETSGFHSSRNSKRSIGNVTQVQISVADASKLYDNVPASPLRLVESSSTAGMLSMETLKDMSTRRAQQCKDIAARILAQGQKEKPSHENNRFPCPAKKMGPAHNRVTAFFSIPAGSPHGMPLICSHAVCCKGRLKFVFCFYCNQPVSRMKFDERHAHPEQLLMALADPTTTTTTKDVFVDGDGRNCEAHASTPNNEL
jgi:hypothetical protein